MDMVTLGRTGITVNPLTMLPIDVRMFKEPFGEGVELLNAFNAERRNKLMPLVSPRAQKWLSAAAAELPG